MSDGFQSSIKRFKAPRGSSIKSRPSTSSIGEVFETREKLSLSAKDRTNHMHVIGSTGTGKSKFLELLLRKDITNRKAGLCLIDPHGSLYDDIMLYAATRHPRLADRVILFNPAREVENVLGFNPIPPDVERMDYLLESLISACLKAWGQDNTDRTPRITKWLENIFHTVISNQLTLVEAAPLLNVQDRSNREKLLRNVHNELVLDDWQMFEASTNTQRQTLIEGAANRLRKFLRNDLIRNIIGQQQSALNFHQAMDEGKIVLVNLNGGQEISHENTKLMGIMIVNEIFRCAKLRDPRDSKAKPFYFYIDEFAQFVTRDIARALEEARKFKLYMILAHQHLAQLKKEDEYLYASVMTNCKTKVVFGGLSREDTDIMADELVTGFVDLKSIKDEHYATKERHHLELRTTRSRSQSETTGETWSDTHGHSDGGGTTENSGYSSGTSSSYDDNFNYRHNDSRGDSHSSGKSSFSSNSSSQTAGGSSSHSESQGTQESWVSVPEEFQELSSRTFWTKDELHYMEAAKIKNQDVAEMFIKIGNRPPQQVEVNYVQPVRYHPRISPKKIDAFRHRSFAAHPQIFTPVDRLLEERNARQVKTFGTVLNFDGTIITQPDSEPAQSTNVMDDSNPFT